MTQKRDKFPSLSADAVPVERATTNFGSAVMVWIDERGAERQISVEDAYSAKPAFENAKPVRRSNIYVGQSHMPGFHWCGKSDRMLAYESRLEAKWLTLLEFDAAVFALSTQPFQVSFENDDEKWRRTPDIFMRRHDGTGVVYDVKPAAKLKKEEVQLSFARMRAVCVELGLEYQVATEPEPIAWAAISWLAGYRREPSGLKIFRDQILELAVEPISIGRLAALVDEPATVLPVIFHLCWHHELVCSISEPLRIDSPVWSAS